MLIDYTTIHRINETKKQLKDNINITSDDIFILQHISVNKDKCKTLKKYGILNRTELIKHSKFDIIKKLSNYNESDLIKKLRDPNICAFFSAKANLDYDNNLRGLPEILNYKGCWNKANDWEKYIITFRIKYKNIEKSGFFGTSLYQGDIIEKLKNIDSNTLKGKIVILNKDYNVPSNDIISINKI